MIPARAGSKGVPQKNLRQIRGKPLIQWTVDVARHSSYIDRLILSTEDEKIAEVGRQCGCDIPFSQPKELASDETPMIAVLQHAIRSLPKKYDYVVLLQPTSPLRLSSDIDAAIELCHKQNAPACVSVCKSHKSPFWMYSISQNGAMKPVFESTDNRHARRQENPDTYVLNGAVYVFRCDWLLDQTTFLTDETLAYIMPEERSIDIDREIDFVLADELLRRRMAESA